MWRDWGSKAVTFLSWSHESRWMPGRRVLGYGRDCSVSAMPRETRKLRLRDTIAPTFLWILRIGTIDTVGVACAD